MKTKAPIIAIIVLILLSLGLGVALVVRHNKAVEQKQQDDTRILQLSNEWTTTSAKLNDQIETNRSLTVSLTRKETELQQKEKEATDLRANLAKAESEKAAVAAAVEKAQAETKAAEQQIGKLNAKIGELENQNLALDKQAGELKTAIAEREAKIADTQKKLAASEGDREFLLKELKRLQAEKAELERQFNDLVVLKEQVRKLKEELAISRRLEWLKRGLYGSDWLHGGQMMQRGLPKPQPKGDTNASLNVEIKKDGSATVVPPGEKK
jgi:chromosome segregation ATPase